MLKSDYSITNTLVKTKQKAPLETTYDSNNNNNNNGQQTTIIYLNFHVNTSTFFHRILARRANHTKQQQPKQTAVSWANQL